MSETIRPTFNGREITNQEVFDDLDPVVQEEIEQNFGSADTLGAVSLLFFCNSTPETIEADVHSFREARSNTADTIIRFDQLPKPKIRRCSN